ncbi:MAG: DMT family transporter [Oscillospiraceae bacterium]|jgi:drug/metabolite transporter (DMT)-like permease|nr:DMT family transporter [Oscillospiraceae bacterium]
MPETQKQRRTQLAGTACLFLTALIWGFAFVAQRAGTSTMGAFTFNGVRFVVGAIALMPVALLFEKGKSGKAERRRTITAGLIAGTVLCFAANLQQLGIDWTQSAARSGFITGLYMIFVPLAGIFLKRKTTKFTWVGALFALGGLYVLSVSKGGGADSNEIIIGKMAINGMLIGSIALIIGAVFWAAHILVVDTFAPRIRPLRFSMAQFWVCAAESLIIAAFTEKITPSGILGGTMPILYTGLLSVGIAYTLQIVGQRHVEPSRASVIFSMESLFSALGEAIILREFLTPMGYLGCGLILAGILLAQIRPKSGVKKAARRVKMSQSAKISKNPRSGT